VADLSLKERCQRRLEGMKANRQSFEADAKEIASYALPARSRFLASQTNKGRQTNRRLNNSDGIFAFRTLQGGMTSGLSSQSRPWFQLTTYDTELADDPSVKMWLGAVEQRMYAFLAHTNFYGAAKTGYLEMGAFGTEACVMLEHPEEGAVCHALTFGEYWIGLNDAMQPGALYRECVMTTIQAVEAFGAKNVSTRIQASYDKGRYDEMQTFVHAIEENDDYIAGRLGFQGKPWRSLYWDINDGKDSVVKLSGYEEQPFWAPRWDTTGNDAWGQGPGHDALPDLRELQLQTKRKAEITDQLVWPEIVVAGKAKLKRQPKSVVSVASVDNVSNLVTVPYEVPYQALEAVLGDIERLNASIMRATFADLFMAITNMAGVQPRNIEEIAARNEEKLTQLGPVIERVNNEKLQIAIERAFGIMQRLRLLPPAPEAMRNSPDIKIEFVSLLTQMQRMVGAGQIERNVQFIGGLSSLYPNARLKLDVNETIDEYARITGLPAKLVRSTEDAEADASAEAQQAQNAQMAEMAAKLGKPVKDMTDAASVAANLPVAATPAVQQALGQ
jgi:hypothetical protein